MEGRGWGMVLPSGIKNFNDANTQMVISEVYGDLPKPRRRVAETSYLIK